MLLLNTKQIPNVISKWTQRNNDIKTSNVYYKTCNDIRDRMSNKISTNCILVYRGMFKYTRIYLDGIFTIKVYYDIMTIRYQLVCRGMFKYIYTLMASLPSWYIMIEWQ